MYWFHDWDWQLWLIMPFTMVVFWGLVIWAVVALIQPSDRSTGPASGTPGPEQILAERYARGEIDAAEYERRQSTLRSAAWQGWGPESRASVTSSAPGQVRGRARRGWRWLQ